MKNYWLNKDEPETWWSFHVLDQGTNFVILTANALDVGFQVRKGVLNMRLKDPFILCQDDTKRYERLENRIGDVLGDALVMLNVGVDYPNDYQIKALKWYKLPNCRLVGRTGDDMWHFEHEGDGEYEEPLD